MNGTIIALLVALNTANVQAADIVDINPVTQEVEVVSTEMYSATNTSEIALDFTSEISYEEVNVSQSTEVVQKEPLRKNKLEFKNIQQLPELPAGCEITSATMALNYYGFNVTKIQMLNHLEIDDDWSNGKGPNPWRTFAGNPRKSYYGAYAPVIEKAINSYFDSIGENGFRAKFVMWKSMDDMYAHIDNGDPVIVWATIKMSSVVYKNSWIDKKTGDLIKFPGGEHCLVLIGYDKDKKTVILSDPYDKRGTVEYSEELFLKRYKQLDSQTVIIQKS